MASPPPLITDPRAPRLLSLADELLEEIFLRLPTPTDLARASTACVAFRRVITDRAFLRRFDAVHAPPFVGLIPEGQDGFYPAQPPYPSAPLARAVANAADFSYSFVPIGRWLKPWLPRDHRQGRVLLECLPKYDDRYAFDEVAELMDLDLVVCDPLHRRYVRLPSVPQEMSAQHGHLVDFDAFFAPPGQDEEGTRTTTSFKVICTARNGTNMCAFVFSSVTRQWCIAASPSWSSLGTEAPEDDHKLAYPDYACGYFYWTGYWVDKLLVFDASKMEFSMVNTAPSSYLIDGGSESGIVAGGEGTPLKFFFGNHREDDSLDILHITSDLNTSEPSDQQHMEKIMPLARQCMYSICGVAEGFLFLHGIPPPGGQPVARQGQRDVLKREYFLLDVRTFELKKICEMEQNLFRVHPFSGFATSLLKPCV